jgi:hypothetical protein
MAVTNNFSVDEFIEHVKVSGILTEEGREYIDVRDVRLIIDIINAKRDTTMEIPKIKEDESLAMWRERLARELNLDYKMQELIREVSVMSYIRGTDVMLDTLKKEGRI